MTPSRLKSDLTHALNRLRDTRRKINPIFQRTIKKLEATENRLLKELEKIS